MKGCKDIAQGRLPNAPSGERFALAELQRRRAVVLKNAKKYDCMHARSLKSAIFAENF